MEDPVRFDLWVRVAPGRHSQATCYLADHCPELSRPVILRTTKASAVDGAWALAGKAMTWSAVQEFRNEPPDWSMEHRIYQEGYGPTDVEAEHCREHDLFFGGCLGCHVCGGFF